MSCDVYMMLLANRITSSSSKELDHSAIILVVDMPEMKMEILLHIQGNMSTRFLSPMRKCLEEPKKTRTCLEAEDPQEIDLSELCDQDQIKQYQTIVGQLIWLTGLGRFDIAVPVMTMLRFRQQTRVAHLERLKRIIGYLASFPHGSLRFKTHEATTQIYLTRSMIGREIFRCQGRSST